MRYPMAEAGHGYTLQARIPARSVVLEGEVHVGDESRGIVLFVHGSGSSRFSPGDCRRTAWVSGSICAKAQYRRDNAESRRSESSRFLLPAQSASLNSTGIRDPRKG